MKEGLGFSPEDSQAGKGTKACCEEIRQSTLKDIFAQEFRVIFLIFFNDS